MKLIKPSFEIYEQGPGLDGIYEAIERAGRTCYKSKRPEGQTAKDFVDRMIASQHYAMLEHGTVYLKFNGPWDVTNTLEVIKYKENPYSKVVGPIYEKDEYAPGERQYSTAYITTNLRVLVENNWLEDLQTEVTYNKCYLCEPTKYHEKRVTVRFTTDRGVSHEFVRHRVFSFAQESTRYCNYSKDKFGNELTFIIPTFLMEEITNHSLYEEDGTLDFCGMATDFSSVDTEAGFSRKLWYFRHSLVEAENTYLELLAECTPQEARQVLPNALKTELVMTGFVSDWEHFFDLRARGTTGAPHPDAKALAEPLMGEFYKRNLIQ